MNHSTTQADKAKNRTGVLIAPELAEELIEGANAFSPEANLDQSEADGIRSEYIRDGVRLGSHPSAPDAETAVLLDKLGARLAFERSGVRLYDGFIRKRATLDEALHPTVEE